MSLFAVAAMAAVWSSSARAQSDTWDGGGGDDNFGTGNNWADNSSPSPGSASDLFFDGSTRLTPNNNYTAFDDFRNITFNSGAGAFTINGNAIELNGKIENLSSNTQTINLSALSLVGGTANEFKPINGNLTINSGSIFTSGSGALFNVFGNNGFTLTFGSSSVISGSGGMRIRENSVVVFQSTHTYTGNTEIDAGRLEVAAGTIGNNSAVFVGRGTSIGIAASLLLTDSNGGLTVGNTITINPGTSITQSNRTLGGTNTSGTNTFSGAIQLGGIPGENRYVNLTAASGGTVEFSGVISGAGQGIYKIGAGTVVLSAATNTYSGDTYINEGILSVLSQSRLGSTSNSVIFNGGTLQFTNTGSGAATSTGRSMIFNSTAIVDTANSSAAAGGAVTFSGSLTGVGGLTKLGTGMLNISGNASYTGATTINNGPLRIDNNAGTNLGNLSGTSSVTVNSGGTLLLNGSASVTDRIDNTAGITLGGGTFNLNGLSEGAPGTNGVGALTLTANSTIDFGAGASAIIQFAGVGTHTPITGADLAIINWNGVPVTGGSGDRLLFSGLATDFSTQYAPTDVSFNGTPGYVVSQFAGFYEVTAVPEPGTWIAALLTIGGIGFMQRRRFGHC